MDLRLWTTEGLDEGEEKHLGDVESSAVPRRQSIVWIGTDRWRVNYIEWEVVKRYRPGDADGCFDEMRANVYLVRVLGETSR